MERSDIETDVPFSLIDIFPLIARNDLDHVDVFPAVRHGPELADDFIDVSNLHRVEPEKCL